MTAAEAKLLAVLGAGAFVLASTYSSINVALPRIQDEFEISLSALKWVSIIGAIMVASLSLSFGRMGDLIGRRRVYRAGIIVYTLGAGLTALAFSFPQLMAFRVFMAVGLAMSNPLAGAIIAEAVAPERRGQAVGLYASLQAAGQLTGPTFGGIVLDLAGWRAIFVSYLGIGVLLCLAQQFLLKGTEERRHEAFDYLGSALLLVGYPSLLIAFSVGPGSGWGSPWTLLWFGIAALGLTSFAARELTFEKPIFHFRFFRSAAFCIAMFTLAVASFVQSPMTLFAPIYLQKVLTIDPFTVGLVMMALPVSTLIAGPVGGALADRYNPRVIAGLGALFTLLAVLLYSRLGVEASVAFVAVALVLIGLGGGFFRPASQVAVYGLVERNDFASVSATLVLLQSLSGTFGATVLVAINEARAGGDDAAAFTSGQQLAFTALLPLLALAVVTSFFGLGARKPRQEEVPAPSRAASAEPRA